MKTTKFAFYLNKYFTVHLPSTLNCSPKTIDSYRYAFIHFLNFMESNGVPANLIEINDLNYRLVNKYLKWLYEKKQNSISTQNQRQAAINSFIKFLMYEFPEYISEFQLILNLPFKKISRKNISYIKTEGVKLLLEQINTNELNGLRDYSIITLMYTTGIRVSELINIKVKDLTLEAPARLLVHGKGQKSRYVPLIKDEVKLLRDYIIKNNLTGDSKLDNWLFKSHLKKQFKRQGINYIFKKYATRAREIDKNLMPNDFSPHKMRHTTAMELQGSGVNLIYIRDLLGHESVKSTEIYARADLTEKRNAIETASKNIISNKNATWENNNNLKDWLKSF